MSPVPGAGGRSHPHGKVAGVFSFTGKVAGLVLLLVSPAGGASSAEALIAAYEKRDVVSMLLDRCAGEITIKRPFPRRVYGRPPSVQVDARTLAHDMERCRFTAEDARAYFEREGARERRLGNRPEIVIAPKSDSSSGAGSSTGAMSLRTRLRKLEQRELGNL